MSLRRDDGLNSSEEIIYVDDDDHTDPKKSLVKCDTQSNEPLDTTEQAVNQVLRLAAPKTPPPPPSPPSYAKGWCGLHVT